MHKEESITGIYECLSLTGQPDMIQEITEKVTVQRLGESKQLDKRSYRRVSDRVDVERLNETTFKVVKTGEKLIIK